MSVPVTVVVMHHKNSAAMNECPRSLGEPHAATHLKGDVIMVDNGGDFEGDVGPGMDLTVIDAMGKLSFLRAGTSGLSTGRGESLLISNNDASPTTGALPLSTEYLRRHLRGGRS